MPVYAYISLDIKKQKEMLVYRSVCHSASHLQPFKFSTNFCNVFWYRLHIIIPSLSVKVISDKRWLHSSSKENHAKC
jgi:hypothetical protein